MWSTFTNPSDTRSKLARAIEAVVAMGTTILATVFVLAAVMPRLGFPLVG